MSGSIDYLSLFSGTTSSADPITSLVADLYSGASVGGGGDPLTALQVAENNQTQDIAAESQQPQVQRTIAAFRSAVAAAKTPADLLNNPQALNVLLTVNGLGSQSQYTALAQKALLSNPNDPNSLASQLASTNSNWKAAAQTYQFATQGLAVLRNPSTLSDIASSYAEVMWRQSLDQTTPGLSNALDFRSRASTITSIDQILGDATFRTVITTALGIPPQIAYQDLGAQEQSIASRVDISKFHDPHFVEGLTQQYLLAEQSQGTSSSGGSLEALAVQASGLVV